MGNPYRKLFNLFAFSLLAFAIYLNFIHTDDDDNLNTKKTATYVQAASSQPKQAVAVEQTKPSRVKKN